MRVDKLVEFHVLNAHRSRRAGTVCENAEVTEPIRSHSADGVRLINDNDLGTERDHGTRSFCGHRNSLVRGSSVFVLSDGKVRSDYSKSDRNLGPMLGCASSTTSPLFRIRVAREFNQLSASLFRWRNSIEFVCRMCTALVGPDPKTVR